MATACEYVSDTSDIVHEYTCSPCDEAGLNAEATGCCMKCKKYFCQLCVKLHNDLYRNHEVLDKGKRSKWIREATSVTGLTCLLHEDRQTEVFCEDHGVVCCLACLALEHGLCRNVFNIKDAAKSTDKLKLHDIRDEAKDLIISLDNSITSRRKQLKCVGEAAKQAQKDVGRNAKALHETIGSLEQASLNEIRELETEFTDTVNIDIQTRICTKETIGKVLLSAKNAGHLDKTSMFVIEKVGKQVFEKTRRLLDSVIPVLDLRFAPTDDIMQALKSKKTLGSVNAPPLPPPRAKSAHTVKSLVKYSIRHDDGRNESDIVAICLLDNGHLAIADSLNQVVKLVDTRYNVIDHAKTGDQSPGGLFRVKGNEFGVTFPSGQSVVLLKDNDGALEQIREIKITCEMVDCHNDKLYCANQYDIDVYSLSGRHQKQHLFRTQSEDDHIMKIKISDDGTRLYVANNSYGLWVLDENGKELFSSNDLLDVLDLSVSANTIFVCSDGNSDKAHVTQLDTTGTSILATMADDKDVAYRSVCFNKRTSQLIVGIKGTKLYVYQLW